MDSESLGGIFLECSRGPTTEKGYRASPFRKRKRRSGRLPPAWTSPERMLKVETSAVLTGLRDRLKALLVTAVTLDMKLVPLRVVVTDGVLVALPLGKTLRSHPRVVRPGSHPSHPRTRRLGRTPFRRRWDPTVLSGGTDHTDGTG